MIVQAPTQSELLGMWERGEGAGGARRALALLSGGIPEAAEETLAAMAIGRRDSALLDLRERLFGDRFTGVTSCPSCGEEIELTFVSAEVRREGAPPAADRFAMREAEFDLEFRVPDSGDLASLELLGNVDAARARLLDRCVLRAERDGAPIAPATLPEPVIDALAARMAEIDPQADVALDVTCPACTHAWREPFDIVSFLWSEVASLARHLLIEVHELALAYGWSERDILSLSPVRRHAYLGMLR